MYWIYLPVKENILPIQPLNTSQINDIAFADSQHLGDTDLFPYLCQRFSLRANPTVPADIDAVLSLFIDIADLLKLDLLDAVLSGNDAVLFILPGQAVGKLFQDVLHTSDLFL